MTRKFVVAVLLLSGCAHAKGDPITIVRTKAAFDLGCTEDQLKVTELGDKSMSNMAGGSNSKSYGVEGCGKRASYDGWCVKAMMMKETCDARQSSAPVDQPGASDSPAP